MGLIRSTADPGVGRHLLRDEGEVIVDEVRHHWVAYIRAWAELTLGVLILLGAGFVAIELGWLVIALAFAVLGHGSWKWLWVYRDRFVITNMRVFRVHGVFTGNQSTMPLVRILDITVATPFAGRLLGYGHLVFESAAQEQGLHDIRYVGRPEERDLSIQRVVQRTGLRGPRVH